MMKLAFVVVALACGVLAHHEEGGSPCAGFFEYEPIHKTAGQWEGVIKFTPEYTLHGAWIRVILDSPAKEVKVLNAEGYEVVIGDDKTPEYLIKNREALLKKEKPYELRLSVAYEADKAPKLVGYRLNGRTICPVGSE